MITYKIIENPPYDKGASSTFWIKKEFKLFGFTFYSRLLGDYKIDDEFGELGYMPFFDRGLAELRLSFLKL